MNNFFRASFLPVLACFSLFCYWLIRYYLSHDLVWDEIVSLKNFTLVDLHTTVTHYPDVNNHLMFNLLNNIYYKILGISDIYTAMDHIVAGRVFPLLITLISVVYVFKISNRFFHKQAGFFAVVILITTIPFLNFTMQLRGYTLSMAFLAMAVYYLWSFEEKPKFLSGLLLVFSLFGLLYSIPSNVYFVLPIGLMYFIKWVSDGRKTSKTTKHSKFSEIWLKNRTFYILLLIGLSSLFAFLAYLPILDDLLNERHLQQLKGQSFFGHTLKNILPFVLFYILSYRFLFLIPLIFIFARFYRNAMKKEWKTEDFRLLFLFGIIVFSFAICLLRGDKPHERTFTPLVISFAVLTGVSTFYYLESLSYFRNKILLPFFTVFVYSSITFFFCLNLVQTTLHKAIIGGDKIYNMFYNFYQSEEYNMAYLDPLISAVRENKYPIIMAREIDRVAEGSYILKNDLNYYSTVWAKPAPAEKEGSFQYQVLLEVSQGKNAEPGYNKIGFPPNISSEAAMFVPLFSFLYQNKLIDQTKPKCYVLTFAPRWFEGVMKTSMPGFKYERMETKISYHNIYLISKK